MGDMTKIVTEHVRASDLPEHLRRGLQDGDFVTVTVECASDKVAVPKRSLSSFLGAARVGEGRSIECIVKEISDLRDEWDHR
jgi:hypothetical protein